MAREYLTEIRVISVDHDRTSLAEQTLAHGKPQNAPNVRIRDVYCHLEAGRCGVASGSVAIEVDGQIIWKGAELTPKLAASFWNGLPKFIEQQKKELGLA